MIFVREIVLLAAIAISLEGTNGKPPSRVVGGEDGEIGEFPYTVSLRKKNRVVCGGVIISDRHVLTAAHCIDGVSSNPWTDVTVVSGTNSATPGAGRSHAIEYVTVHPEYSNRSDHSWINDIAVVALKRPIVFDFFTKSVQLPERETPGGWPCVASGWGDMSYPKGIEPNNIRKASFKTLDNADCQKAHRLKIYGTHLCALNGLGVGLCTGDSGGPLVHEDTVVGIASFVTRCAKGKPDVFSRVYSYIDFIREAMANT